MGDVAGLVGAGEGLHEVPVEGFSVGLPFTGEAASLPDGWTEILLVG